MAGTGNPVPSDAIADLKANAETMDQFVSSGSDFVVGRTTPSFPSGKNIRTLTGINAVFDAAQAGQFVADSEAAAGRAETAAEIAMTAGWVYATVADGEAARVDGDYFWVVSSDNSEVLELWLMGSLAATDTEKRLYTNEYIAGLIKRMRVDSSKIPLFRFDDGKIPLWLENGLLDSTGIGTVLSKAIETMLGDKGLALSEAPSGYPPLMIKTSNGKVVFVVNKDGEAYYYGNLGQSTQGELKTTGSSLYRYKAKLAKLINKQGGAVKVALTGDSWRERRLIPQVIAEDLYDKYGRGADGWIGLRYTTSSEIAIIKPLNDALLTHSGWTLSDISSGSKVGLYAPDGHRLDCDDNLATLSCVDIKAEIIKIYYLDNNGSFRYRVDGGTWNTVNGSSSGVTAKVEVTGLSAASLHDIEIDTSVNSGTVSLFGIYATGISGIEVNKIANGGSMAEDYSLIVEDESYSFILSDIENDLVEICLGTNDFSKGSPPNSYSDGLANILNAYKSASNGCGVIITSPPVNGGTGAFSMDSYWVAAKEVVSQYEVEHYDQYSNFGDFAVMNEVGVWNDTLHLNSAGAYFSQRELCSKFLTVFEGL